MDPPSFRTSPSLKRAETLIAWAKCCQTYETWEICNASVCGEKDTRRVAKNAYIYKVSIFLSVAS
jgi:hypothetical protein